MKKGVELEQGVLIEFGATIDPDGGVVKIGSNSVIKKGGVIKCYGGVVQIGERCTLNPFSIIYGHSRVDIGNNVLIAAGVVIVSANHRIKRNHTIRGQGLSLAPIKIGNDVWIGAHSCILAGVLIEDGVVISANTTVKRGVYSQYKIYSINSSYWFDERKEDANA